MLKFVATRCKDNRLALGKCVPTQQRQSIFPLDLRLSRQEVMKMNFNARGSCLTDYIGDT